MTYNNKNTKTKNRITKVVSTKTCNGIYSQTKIRKAKLLIQLNNKCIEVFILQSSIACPQNVCSRIDENGSSQITKSINRLSSLQKKAELT